LRRFPCPIQLSTHRQPAVGQVGSAANLKLRGAQGPPGVDLGTPPGRSPALIPNSAVERRLLRQPSEIARPVPALAARRRRDRRAAQRGQEREVSSSSRRGGSPTLLESGPNGD